MTSASPDARVYAATLSAADAKAAEAETTEAARLFAEAAAACFDRSLHFDGLSSPIAESPEEVPRAVA